MKIAVAQVRCLPGDPERNCAQIAPLAKKAKGQGCDLVVFPEMVDTGYEMSAIKETASSWTGLPFSTVKHAAIDCGIHLICGLSEREGEKIYNSVGVFDPGGNLIGKYRKTHLFSPDPVNEDRYITAGDSLEMVQVDDLKLGLLICYVLRFPEVGRNLAKSGAQVLVVCSAWPFPRERHWKILTAARAIENQCYAVAANRIGTDGPLTFCGSSCIIDPEGMVMESGSVDKEELLIAEISADAVVSLRDRIPTLRDRREDLYHRLPLSGG